MSDLKHIKDFEEIRNKILCKENTVTPYCVFTQSYLGDFYFKGYSRFLLNNDKTAYGFSSYDKPCSQEVGTSIQDLLSEAKCLYIDRDEEIYISDRSLFAIKYENIYRKKVSIYVISSFEEDIKKLEEIDKKYQSTTQNIAHTIIQQGQNLSIASIGSIYSPLVDINYTPNVIEDYRYIAAQLESPSPNGRLAVFYGPPGSGKTHLIKALISELTKAKVIVFPSSLVSSLDGPALISLFFSEQEKNSGSKRKPIVLVIEDADDSLTKRTANNMSSISAILNTADGILGTCLDIRIVATTNAKEFEIDEALLRTGRLLSCIHVDILPPEQCSLVYKKITGKEKTFNKPTVLSDIYAEANKSIFINKFSKPEKKMGFM